MISEIVLKICTLLLDLFVSTYSSASSTLSMIRDCCYDSSSLSLFISRMIVQCIHEDSYASDFLHWNWKMIDIVWSALHEKWLSWFNSEVFLRFLQSSIQFSDPFYGSSSLLNWTYQISFFKNYRKWEIIRFFQFYKTDRDLGSLPWISDLISEVSTVYWNSFLYSESTDRGFKSNRGKIFEYSLKYYFMSSVYRRKQCVPQILWSTER